MRLLLIEGDRKLAGHLPKGLAEEGFVVEHASSGPVGLGLALGACYDVAAIDIMLPELDGLAIIEQLRQHRINFPVIILSA